MRDVEVLIAARKLIEKPESWVRGPNPIERGRGRHCIVTAIYEVGGPSGSASQRYLRSAIKYPLIPWNDAPTRTHAEVLAAFDRAIALAEAEETHAAK